jgi:hypothetical protein
MKQKITLLTAALSLIMSALTAQAANITIPPALPFTVPAAGTYVLTGNLNFTGTGATILIPANLQGSVIVDLERIHHYWKWRNRRRNRGDIHRTSGDKPFPDYY